MKNQFSIFWGENILETRKYQREFGDYYDIIIEKQEIQKENTRTSEIEP